MEFLNHGRGAFLHDFLSKCDVEILSRYFFSEKLTLLSAWLPGVSDIVWS